MAIQVVRAPVPLAEIAQLAREQFGDFVKSVVDVRRGVMAVGGELHADEERRSWTRARSRPTCGGSTSTPIGQTRSESSSTR